MSSPFRISRMSTPSFNKPRNHSLFAPRKPSLMRQASTTSFGGNLRRNCGLGVKIAKILSNQLSAGLSELVISSKCNSGSNFSFVVANLTKSPGKLAYKLKQQLVQSLPSSRHHSLRIQDEFNDSSIMGVVNTPTHRSSSRFSSLNVAVYTSQHS